MIKATFYQLHVDVKKIDRVLKMMSDALTNVEKHVTSNIAYIYAHTQPFTRLSLLIGLNDVVCLTLQYFLPIVGPNVISNGPTNELSICPL